ncbi:MAG: exodeoxyribonuclease I [Pseudomonadota bacterium]
MALVQSNYTKTMAQTFYWYDLETSGTDPRWDRIVQFAGLRTDAALNEVGDAESFYVRLPDDVLPNPDATLVTGITPERARAEGVSEWQALTRIHALFAEPGTCVAGYNSLRFDDEFVRHGLYRALLDPYAREWQNGNSRWDIIDLVRAAGALRRDGIEWPTDDDGLPVYKLERLTEANGIDHGNAHDALSDVRATVALARLIRERQPRLFEYYFGCRNKKSVRALLEPFGARLCVHVSGMYPRERFGTAPVVSVCRHPTNANVIIVADLAEDVEPLVHGTEAEIREALFEPGNRNRPPLKQIRLNRCPFVAGIEVLDDENTARLGFDYKLIRERQRRLSKPGLAQKLMRVFSGGGRGGRAADAEAALYDGFIGDDDRSRCRELQARLAQGEWQDLDYGDPRLVTLAARLKARSFPELMSPEELADWRDFVRDKLTAAETPWWNMARFHQRLVELGAERSPDDPVLAALSAHGQRLVRDYGL